MSTTAMTRILSTGLPLYQELFLLAHDDDTGHPHIHPDALAAGLAGAVLIDLYLTGQITLTHNATHGQHITLTGAHSPHPGSLARQVLYTAGVTPALRPWLRAVAIHLHTRTREHLVAAGVLRHHTRRRLGGLLRRDIYLPTHHRWPVIARAQLRHLATGQEQPDNHSAALAGLVTALGLHPWLYLGLPDSDTRDRLQTIADGHLRPVRHILTAVDATIGDLATATYR